MKMLGRLNQLPGVTGKKTSAEWQKLNPEVLVYDADGWDRKNYEYAWNVERITKKEYKRRRSLSTCKWTVAATNESIAYIHRWLTGKD